VRLRVLLVDDAAEIRQLVRTALRFRGGFEVVAEASTGHEALTLARAEQPDVVVLDLGLPDLAGEEVLTRIRAESPRSKVVIFSARDAPDRAWFADRVEGFVLKDATLDLLVDVLASVGSRTEEHLDLELPADPASVAEARAFVRTTFASWDVDYELTQDVLIIASELVTNAITHANSACELRLAADEAKVRISVLDRGDGTPDLLAHSDTRPHGRGLHIVGALSTAWGVDRMPEGKLVWAQIRR
jgi:CheY-like chemotaxis protein